MSSNPATALYPSADKPTPSNPHSELLLAPLTCSAPLTTYPAAANTRVRATPLKLPHRCSSQPCAQVQKHMRSSYVAKKYKKEMQLRQYMSVKLQSHYRSHADRVALKARLAEEEPAAALVQAAIRGRLTRKSAAADGETAADGTTPSGAAMPPAPSSADAMMSLKIRCADGEVPMKLRMPGSGGEADEVEYCLRVKTASGVVPVALRVKTAAAADPGFSITVHATSGADVPLMLHLPPMN